MYFIIHADLDDGWVVDRAMQVALYQHYKLKLMIPPKKSPRIGVTKNLYGLKLNLLTKPSSRQMGTFHSRQDHHP